MSSYRKDRELLRCGKIKTDWTMMLLSFLVFCMIGWIYEVLVFYFELGYGFVNRGFLFGSWLPVYGCGGMLILLSMKRLQKKKITVGKINVTPLLCFIAIILLCTTVELLTSYIMELATGSWLWDYTEDGSGKLPDGTPVPALQPLKDRKQPPKKDECHPGYPSFICGEVGMPPRQPPCGVLDADGKVVVCPTSLEEANFVENAAPGALYTDTCPCHTTGKCPCRTGSSRCRMVLPCGVFPRWN